LLVYLLSNTVFQLAKVARIADSSVPRSNDQMTNVDKYMLGLCYSTVHCMYMNAVQ